MCFGNFPPSYIRNEENEKNFIHFLAILPKDIGQAIEFRTDSWFATDTYKLLNKFNAGFVINDTSAFATTEMNTGEICYIRFHGPGKLYSTAYSDLELGIWAEKIKKYRKKRDVYCYFNNDVSGYAIQNAIKLRELVK